MSPISADILASKLSAISHQEYPRLAEQFIETPRLLELLNFIQWTSRQPGGLPALARMLIERFPNRIAPDVVTQFGLGKPWAADQCMAVWSNLRRQRQRGFLEFTNASDDGAIDHPDDQTFAAFNFAYFYERSKSAAEEQLAFYLESLCSNRPQPLSSGAHWHFDLQDYSGRLASPWYFTSLIPSLFEHMDLHAEETRRRIARTKVVDLVFKRLDFGMSSKHAVMILGDSRIGKTTAVETWCKMRPGRARLVTVPDCNREWEFLAAHADALGIDYTDKTTRQRLSREVTFAVANMGLFIVYDESHFLFPQRFSKNTAPHRLNWIRSHVIDRGVGAAFFATRQAYSQAMDKFVKTTQYQMEQWLGRIAPPLILPAKPEASEMLSAARTLFPQVDERLLGVMAARCIKMEVDFQQLSTVCSYACFLAKRRGCAVPEIEDVDGALNELFGVACAAKSPTLRDRSATRRISSVGAAEAHSFASA